MPHLGEGAIALDVERDLVRMTALATGAASGAGKGVPLCKVVRYSPLKPFDVFMEIVSVPFSKLTGFNIHSPGS